MSASFVLAAQPRHQHQVRVEGTWCLGEAAPCKMTIDVCAGATCEAGTMCIAQGRAAAASLSGRRASCCAGWRHGVARPPPSVHRDTRGDVMVRRLRQAAGRRQGKGTPWLVRLGAASRRRHGSGALMLSPRVSLPLLASRRLGHRSLGCLATGAAPWAPRHAGRPSSGHSHTRPQRCRAARRRKQAHRSDAALAAHAGAAAVACTAWTRMLLAARSGGASEEKKAKGLGMPPLKWTAARSARTSTSQLLSCPAFFRMPVKSLHVNLAHPSVWHKRLVG